MQALTMRELRKYNAGIACLSEVRIPESGHSVVNVSGYIYHSGVSIALSEAAQAALLSWVPISSRLAGARLKGTTVNLTVVGVYVPTRDTVEEAKDSFYDDLQDGIDRFEAGEMLIVAGDWNARPGHVDTTTWHILCKFAVDTRCANGDRLVNFASANRLVVSSTHIQHPQRHLVTWFSNHGRTRNQIGHMRSHWASSVIDCRVDNGTQTGSEHGSDHAMDRARLRLHIKAACISKRPGKFDTATLKTVALEHRHNRFEGLQLDKDASLEAEWRELKETIETLPRHI